MWGSGDEKDPIGQVSDDFTVEIDPERLSISRLATLTLFAEPVLPHARRPRYQLTPETVERGRSRGVTSREIMFLLRHIHGRNLPAQVAESVGEWAEGFGQATLQKAVWLRGEAQLMDQIEQGLGGVEPLAKSGNTTVLLSHLELDELIDLLSEHEIFPDVHPLRPVFKAYAAPVSKENGLFNHSLRTAYELYCCLRDRNLAAVSEPWGTLFRRYGHLLGVSGKTARWTKDQQAAINALAGQRLWDLQLRLVKLYLDDQEYSEISGFEQDVSEQVVRELHHLRQPYQVRQKMADYLRELSPLEWTSLLPFVRRLRKESPKVIRATRSWDWSYLRRQDRPWEEVEDYWLMHLITHEFWWLGIVELYWTKAHGPMAFRLTADGFNLLSGQEPAPRRAVVMAPTGWTVLEPQQMTVEELTLLMQFVAPQPLTCQWSVYWDRRTLHDAVVRGIPLVGLTKLLEKQCPEIPMALTELVAELTRQGERVSVHESYLLTCQEPVLLDSLLAVKSLALCIEERISPTAAVVYPAAVNRLLRGSERNGISISTPNEGNEA